MPPLGRARPLVALAAGAALGVAAACAVGPDYERPELSVSSSYRDWPEQVDAIADLPWWGVVRDDAVAQVIREALENNGDRAVVCGRGERARYGGGGEGGEVV